MHRKPVCIKQFSSYHSIILNRIIQIISGTSSARIGNTVLVKLPNGQTKPMTKLSKRPFDLVRVQKNSVPVQKNARSLIASRKPPANLTPSVSIAPVGKKPMPMSAPTSDTESENEEYMTKNIPKQKRMSCLFIKLSKKKIEPL